LIVRLGLETGFRQNELYTLAIAGGLLLSFCVVTAPMGFVAALALGGVIIDRALEEAGWTRPERALPTGA
jgi:hypothetical protein